jgi:hypothetical protein
MKLLKKYYSFVITSSYKRILVVGYIAILSVLLKVIVKYLPLKWYYNYFFNNHCHEEQDLQPFINEIDHVKRIIKSLPWNCSCLIESFILHIYFRKSNLLLPIELGISLKNNFRAHAWNFESSRRGYNKIHIK